MESLLERLSSYNILNNLIPGAFFVFFGKLLNVISLPLDGVVERIFVYYFCGMIISRIGSLVIEGIFEKVKWIKYAPKAEYVAAVKKDARIESLLETSNMYRTCAGLFLTLGIVKVRVVWEVSNGGIGTHSSHQEIYFKGRAEDNNMFTFSRDLSYYGTHLLRCKISNARKGTITRIFKVVGV